MRLQRKVLLTHLRATAAIAKRARLVVAASVTISGAAFIGEALPALGADLPNSSVTPGATFPVTIDQFCLRGYTACVRSVSKAESSQAYASYGIRSHAPGEYEVDHLISLELGGSNAIQNLWPQSYVTHPWNAHVKDLLENRLHDLVCSGQIGIQEAQHEISANWIAAYQKYGGEPRPLVYKGTITPQQCRSLHQQFVGGRGPG
jgi:hypothetical protein